MATLYTSDFETGSAGSLPTGWVNAVGSAFGLRTTGALAGSQSFGATAGSNNDIAVYTGISATADMEMLVLVSYNANGLVAPFLRATSNGASGYLIGTMDGTTAYIFSKVSGSFSSIGSGAHGLSLSNGDKVWVRAQAIGTAIKARVWKDGTSEPGTWTATVTSSAVSAAGYAGLRLATNGSTTALADSMTVTDGVGDYSTVTGTTPLGDQCFVNVPTGYSATAGADLVLFQHGAGEAWNAFIDGSYAPRTLLETLFGQAGYLIAGSAGGGTDTWGNAAGRNSVPDLYGWVLSQYRVNRVLLLSQSMGGLAGLQTCADTRVPVAGAYLIYPVCNLSYGYGSGSGPFASQIATAFGLANSGEYATKTSGFDPLTLTTYPNISYRFTASASDTTVSKTCNTDAMRTYLAGLGLTTTLRTHTGGHGDTSAWDYANDCADIMTFFASVPARTTGARAASGCGWRW